MQEALVRLLRHSEISFVENIAGENVISIFLLALSSSSYRRSEHLKEDKLDIRNNIIEFVSRVDHAQY